jgi:hypothetical protein
MRRFQVVLAASGESDLNDFGQARPFGICAIFGDARDEV